MGRLKRTEATRRLSLDMPESVRDRLERLREQTGADSLAEVIRRSLAVYELLWEQKAANAEIIVEKDGKKKTIVLV
jgi:hypothetical protein